MRTVCRGLLLILVAGCATSDTVRIDQFDIARGQDPDLVFTRAGPPDWNPNGDEPLDVQLPVPWPEQYVEEFGQAYNPWTFQVNAALLCAHVRANPHDTDLVEQLAADLYERMIEYTEVQGGARFVVYDFEHRYEDHILEPGWVSGFGNGAAIAGTLALDECWPEQRYIDTAYELAAAYEITSRDGLWFSRITDDDLLWFEEVAVEERQMILNGHVTALIGLYYLWDRDGQDADVERLLQAGLAAVREHVGDFRRPGQTVCYDLSPPCHDDYGPERAVRHQQVLFDMTGDPVFREMRDAFAADMGIDAEQFIRD